MGILQHFYVILSYLGLGKAHIMECVEYPSTGVKPFLDDQGYWRFTPAMEKWYLHGSKLLQSKAKDIDSETSYWNVEQLVITSGLSFIMQDYSSGFTFLQKGYAKFKKTDARGIFGMLNKQAIIQSLPDLTMKRVPLESFPLIVEKIKEMDSTLIIALASIFLRLNELGSEMRGVDRALAFSETLLTSLE